MITRKHQYVSNKRTRNKYTNHQKIVSSQHIKILKRFWKSICKNKKEQSISTIRQLEDSDYSEIRENPMYSNIPDKIRRDFESSSQQGIRYNTTLKRGRNVAIYIAFPSKANLHTKIPIYLNNIIAWLNFISEFASSQCSQTLNIYLLLNDAKKQIPEIDTEPIDTINANTAFTTACSRVNYIFIFRREEWFKVLMHETFHCFGLDFSSSVGDESNQCILSIFPAVHPNTDIRLYETFCEMWAEIFYFMFCSFTNSAGKPVGFSKSLFIREVRREQLFSIYQSNKVLNRSGFQYRDMMQQLEKDKPQYRENTQAFSYYVLKSLMLWNIDAFLAWCVKNNGLRHIIQFDESRIPEYCEFVADLVKTDGSYKRMIERMNSPLNINIQHNNMYNMKTTMRMTITDPGWI
jgi:hypothetical protein